MYCISQYLLPLNKLITTTFSKAAMHKFFFTKFIQIFIFHKNKIVIYRSLTQKIFLVRLKEAPA